MPQQAITHAPRSSRDTHGRLSAVRATRPPSHLRPVDARAKELGSLLPALKDKVWLRTFDVLETPPTVFQVHGITERCVELVVFGRPTWVRIAWEPDADGTRAALVDQAIELARLQHQRGLEGRLAEDHERSERLARTARMAFEMELRAARAIAADAMLRQEDAERMTADAERRQIARDQVVAASALFASVAHDIRSPLTALVLNLRILEEQARSTGVLPAGTQSMFDDTRLACDLIEGVLDGLRTYASCSGVPRRLALRPIVDCAVRLFRWHMQQRGIAISWTVEGDPEAWGTTSEICQILLNLLANAAEASPRGSTVVLECSANERGSQIRIDDDGPGIGSADPESIFQPFRSSKEDGFGIGLTVARAMARRHGGDLVVVPPRRRGASFELQLTSASR